MASRKPTARLLAAVLGATAVLACAPAEPPRGVILLSLDTLRADHLGCYGYPRPTSPFLDRLAAEGVLFEHAVAPGSWTVPSHASLLSGLYPRSHGVVRHLHQPKPGTAMLPALLRRSGFSTAALFGVPLLERFKHGFGEFTLFAPALDGTTARKVNAAALHFLRDHRSERFFLFAHHFDAHSDYRPRRRWRQAFAEPYAGSADGTTLQLKEVRLGNHSLAEVDARHLVNLYDAGIRQLDAELESFFATAQEEGLLDGVLVVITSDHGEEFLDHGGVLHGRTLHQELIHVPLIFWGAGIPVGVRVTAPVSLVDVMPTLITRLGLDVPPEVEGIDLTPSWRDGARDDGERSLFSEADIWIGRREANFRRAVRRGRYTLHYDARTDSYALFDVAADPLEQTDVAGRAPETAAALRRELEKFMGAEAAEAPGTPLSEEQLQQLRKLGYVE